MKLRQNWSIYLIQLFLINKTQRYNKLSFWLIFSHFLFLSRISGKFCSVQLQHNKIWFIRKSRWSVIHGLHRYLFFFIFEFENISVENAYLPAKYFTYTFEGDGDSLSAGNAGHSLSHSECLPMKFLLISITVMWNCVEYLNQLMKTWCVGVQNQGTYSHVR